MGSLSNNRISRAESNGISKTEKEKNTDNTPVTLKKIYNELHQVYGDVALDEIVKEIVATNISSIAEIKKHVDIYNRLFLALYPIAEIVKYENRNLSSCLDDDDLVQVALCSVFVKASSFKNIINYNPQSLKKYFSTIMRHGLIDYARRFKNEEVFYVLADKAEEIDRYLNSDVGIEAIMNKFKGSIFTQSQFRNSRLDKKEFVLRKVSHEGVSMNMQRDGDDAELGEFIAAKPSTDITIRYNKYLNYIIRRIKSNPTISTKVKRQALLGMVMMLVEDVSDAKCNKKYIKEFNNTDPLIFYNKVMEDFCKIFVRPDLLPHLKIDYVSEFVSSKKNDCFCLSTKKISEYKAIARSVIECSLNVSWYTEKIQVHKGRRR